VITATLVGSDAICTKRQQEKKPQEISKHPKQISDGVHNMATLKNQKFKI